MRFWEYVSNTTGMPGAYFWVLPGMLLVVLTLYIGLPDERRRVIAALFLFALSVGGLLIGSALLWLGLDGHPSYLAVRGITRFLESVAVTNLASIFVFCVAMPAIRLNPPRIMQDLILGIAYLVIALLVLSSSGVDLRGIVATSAVMTAVIGFSLQDTLGNIMAGMAVQMDRTIRVGDWIRLGEIEGQVQEIRWRHTSVETRDWDTVVIPNSMLMKGTVQLLGRRNGAPVQRRQWIYFNVDFSHSPTEVIRAVEAAISSEAMPDVARIPAPHCIVTSLAENHTTYAARYWLTDFARPDPVDSHVRTRIFSALRRAGIPFWTPTQAIFLTENDEKYRDRERSEQMALRNAAIEKIALFQTLTTDERTRLGSRLISAPFVAGETMTRQGAEGHWLYIVVEGEAEVNISVDGKTQYVAGLRGGDYFGEMSMMTGEPRSATVVARTDVLAYRVAKHDFEDILRRRPEIAVDIAHTLSRRHTELEVVKEEVSEELKKARIHESHGTILARIHAFFGLEF